MYLRSKNKRCFKQLSCSMILFENNSYIKLPTLTKSFKSNKRKRLRFISLSHLSTVSLNNMEQ